MSNILILKVEEDEITEEEALAVVDNIAKQFKLRITVHERGIDEDARYDTLASLEDLHRSDLQKNLDNNDLLPLVDEEHGIIGYLIDGPPAHELMDVLNGR